MNILLDTHMLIWALRGSPKLSEAAKELILNEDNTIFYSVVSLWEIEMKHNAKPENLPISAWEVFEYCGKAGYEIVRLKENSVLLLPKLTRSTSAPPHKDPFDRILICQSIAESMTFLTHDSLLGQYNVGNIVVV